METLIMLFCFALGIFVGQPGTQKKIEYFNKPVCIEKTIGTEEIKKCYKLVEVKQ